MHYHFAIRGQVPVLADGMGIFFSAIYLWRISRRLGYAIPLFSGCHSIYITVEENNSWKSTYPSLDTTCHSASQSSVVLTKRFSSWQKNHALYTGFEPVIAPFGRRFTAKLPEGYRRLDEGSTTQTQAHIHLYTAPKLPKEVNRRLEPKPSARVMELPIKVELISKHYKCFVITVILWKHIYWVGSQLLPIYMIAISWAYCKSPRCQRWDSNPLNTSLWHMARAQGNDPHWTFIQPRFSKPVPYLSAIPAYGAQPRCRSPQTLAYSPISSRD